MRQLSIFFSLAFTLVLTLDYTLANKNLSTQDKIYLRNGEIWQGKIISSSDKFFNFEKENKEKVSIPKLAIKYILYSDFEKNKEKLGLKKSLTFYDSRINRKQSKRDLQEKNSNENSQNKIKFLPTVPYGEQLIEEIENAKKSIYILTYLISGTKSEPINQIIAILEQKAKQGVDVRLIMSQDAGTRQPVRVMNLREGRALAEKGVKVKYSEGGRVMHKKAWIIDEKITFVGSSNFTLSSFLYENNANIMVNDKKLASDVLQDFIDLWKKCKSVE